MSPSGKANFSALPDILVRILKTLPELNRKVHDNGK